MAAVKSKSLKLSNNRGSIITWTYSSTLQRSLFYEPLPEAPNALYSQLPASQQRLSMDTAIGQFRGAGGANTTAIVLPGKAQDRNQSLIVAAAMGSLIFVVLASFMLFLALRLRAQKRRLREVHSRTKVVETGVNV
ncbi:hypothetical protein G7Z17_g9404 [Cylindrodendrum hubeiense]|uniref:Uncharacterized protein n=1 Tax=Cylindrodendrum hubeiense TaxID=595255 RepID=A0A9P5H7Y8_9HYPO|nr:hypothetical protein G7Z17_g9404 [Cylindrodendrum hubeiense]